MSRSDRAYIISRCIKKEYPNLEFEIEKNKLGGTTFNFKTFTMSLVEEMNWADIKRFINKYSKERETFECNICMETNYALVPCNKCSNDICMRCTANIIETNDGIHKCPYCSIETGFKLPWINVLQIRDNLLIRNYDINKKMNNPILVL